MLLCFCVLCCSTVLVESCCDALQPNKYCLKQIWNHTQEKSALKSPICQERDEAATDIQAAYKGYKVRRESQV